MVGDQRHPYDVYYFTENRSRAGPEEFLKDFSGALVAYAYVCYDSLQSEWTEQLAWACCHAHARRKFEEGLQLGATPQTTKTLSYFHLLFDIEDEARERSVEARFALREEESRPILDQLKTWMDEQLTTLRPQAPAPQTDRVHDKALAKLHAISRV